MGWGYWSIPLSMIAGFIYGMLGGPIPGYVDPEEPEDMGECL